MNPLDYLKMYWQAFVGVVILAAIISVSVYVYVIKKQRDSARASLATAQLLIANYKKESDDAKARTQTLVALAASNEVADAEVIAKLKAQVATSDEEARKLAIQAGNVIGGLK